MCRNKHNKRSGKHRGKCIKSGNNECRKCPKNAKILGKIYPVTNGDLLAFDHTVHLIGNRTPNGLDVPHGDLLHGHMISQLGIVSLTFHKRK